jgi:hypothetical protein
LVLAGARETPLRYGAAVPTIARIGPYRFFFFSNDSSEPEHVHVQREDSLAKLWLRPVVLASASGFSGHELRQIERLVVRNRDSFEEAWREFFAPSR